MSEVQDAGAAAAVVADSDGRVAADAPMTDPASAPDRDGGSASTDPLAEALARIDVLERQVAALIAGAGGLPDEHGQTATDRVLTEFLGRIVALEHAAGVKAG